MLAFSLNTSRDFVLLLMNPVIRVPDWVFMINLELEALHKPNSKIYYSLSGGKTIDNDPCPKFKFVWPSNLYLFPSQNLRSKKSGLNREKNRYEQF